MMHAMSVTHCIFLSLEECVHECANLTYRDFEERADKPGFP